MVMTVEVYDEAELAEMVERAEREQGVQSIRDKVFQGTKEEAEALYDPNKECEECGAILSKERQLASPLATLCTSCAAWFEEEELRKKKLSAMQQF